MIMLSFFFPIKLFCVALCALDWLALQAGTVVNPRTMVPTVKILDVNVRFVVRSDAKMQPSFLRCFPNIETLHIHVRLRL
jgi:hypothetical protein